MTNDELKYLMSAEWPECWANAPLFIVEGLVFSKRHPNCFWGIGEHGQWMRLPR